MQEGDYIDIDIPNRTIHLRVDDAELAARRAVQEAKGWMPAHPRARNVTTALRAYAAMTTSAALGAIRRIPGDIARVDVARSGASGPGAIQDSVGEKAAHNGSRVPATHV